MYDLHGNSEKVRHWFFHYFDEKMKNLSDPTLNVSENENSMFEEHFPKKKIFFGDGVFKKLIF